MPVTARLSKAFYDRFGETVTNELVDWFNAVDSTYRSDLRAELKAEIAAVEVRIVRWMFMFWTGNLVATAGIVLGRAAPRWQETQVTSRCPSKWSRLIAKVMAIILRAVSFSFLSSFSFARSTWQ